MFDMHINYNSVSTEIESNCNDLQENLHTVYDALSHTVESI